jgi:hypothetical protein
MPWQTSGDKEDKMSVMIGREGSGWRVTLKGFGFVTRSDVMSKREALSLAAYCLLNGRKPAK